MKPCQHNHMVQNNGLTHAWKCADCGYVYGQDLGLQSEYLDRQKLGIPPPYVQNIISSPKHLDSAH
jgi:hypothetical protein